MRYFAPSARAAYSMFDLNFYTVERLHRAGAVAEALNHYAYTEEKIFYPYRRIMHPKEVDSGRQISAIVLED